MNGHLKEIESDKGAGMYHVINLFLFQILIHSKWRSRDGLPVRCYHIRTERGCLLFFLPFAISSSVFL